MNITCLTNTVLWLWGQLTASTTDQAHMQPSRGAPVLTEARWTRGSGNIFPMEQLAEDQCQLTIALLCHVWAISTDCIPGMGHTYPTRISLVPRKSCILRSTTDQPRISRPGGHNNPHWLCAAVSTLTTANHKKRNFYEDFETSFSAVSFWEMFKQSS